MRLVWPCAFASSLSRPNTITEVIIPAKRTIVASTKSGSPRPGKPARKRGINKADESANMTKIAAATASPILCPVVSASTSAT